MAGPALAQTQTEKIDVQPELAPDVRARLEALLDTYKELAMQCDALDAQMGTEKQHIWEVLEAAGISKTAVSGMLLNVIRGTTSKLDKGKFVALGGSLTMLEEATVIRPKKAYLDIRDAKKPKNDWEG